MFEGAMGSEVTVASGSAHRQMWRERVCHPESWETSSCPAAPLSIILTQQPRSSRMPPHPSDSSSCMCPTSPLGRVTDYEQHTCPWGSVQTRPLMLCTLSPWLVPLYRPAKWAFPITGILLGAPALTCSYPASPGRVLRLETANIPLFHPTPVP